MSYVFSKIIIHNLAVHNLLNLIFMANDWYKRWDYGVIG